jgi:hypothetical protein
VKGADQCPRCGSRATRDFSHDRKFFYGPIIRGCKNCATVWEPYDPADTIDPDDRYASFKTPCNNCAFRKGSPEQSDKDAWESQMINLSLGAAFYCHKGVPITPGKGHGFEYPEGQRHKLRLCRGYLNSIVGPRLKEFAIDDADETGDEPWDDQLTEKEKAMIDAAWELHKAAKPNV